MKVINIEKLSELLSNNIASKHAEISSYEMPDDNYSKPITNPIKENSYLMGFFQARNILIEYLKSEEKYVEIGGEYTLDVGSGAPIEVKVIKIFSNYVECEYLSSYSGRIENLGFELFKMNGYEFK